MWQAWDRDEGLEFVVRLQGFVMKHGFNCGITGSILLRPYKIPNDLDIIIYPNNNYKVDLTVLKSVFESMELTQVADRIKTAQVWAKKGSEDTKHVEVWETKDKKKIDFFFLR